MTISCSPAAEAAHVVDEGCAGVLAQHTPVLAEALASDGDLRDRCIALLRELRPALATATGGGTPVPDDMIRRIDELAASFARRPGTPPAIARSARKLAH